MSKKRLSLQNRVRAVVEATQMATADGAGNAPWQIVFALEQPAVDLVRVRCLVDEALLDAVEVYQRPYYRLRAAKLEEILGIGHHPVTAEAVAKKAASEGMRGHDTPWMDYVRAVRLEPEPWRRP
ncbi:hypothetical protein PQJ75_14035 [Rhodoplanes sp. TEM]|uniref:Uncharacterized protein n=1 Tax=Rhodoplanes tepidamans TaxID=200616 RepID=A0ABT5JEG0_RHOTP|nr:MULTISPECIES: hypothetical protein [Rhodoplanes]MDC7788012.1 hypothetical protein [Rhodoplanes tepidamans]MDC7984852.1 hypothetical protein [Rhodoplanes sp. TEM]MDQ0358441.1 hypothetical protein [Rhodoplanes tepidamans]